ncbi:hypothetical protein MRX96_014944 [Rhipicephalus microplus]
MNFLHYSSDVNDAIRPEDETFRILFAITAICIFIGLIGFVGFMLLGAADALPGTKSPDQPTEVGPPAVGPTPARPTPPSPRKPPGPTEAPSKSFSVDELVCTVGATSVLKEMNPPDGLCHYIYYDSVVVTRSKLVGVEVNTSWTTFITSLSTYTTTTGGIGFDVRYSPASEMNATTEQDLKELARQNIKHYGVLNVLDIPDKINKRFADAKELLSTLKGYQEGDGSRKTLIAMGILNYKHPNAMSFLRDIFQDAVNQHVADTVIVYSSLSWIESNEECYSHPPSVFDRTVYSGASVKEADRAPDIKSISRLMTKDKSFTSDAKMGLSLELGTLVYGLRNPASSFDAVNAQCMTLYVTNLDVLPCRINLLAIRNELFEGVNVAELKNDTLKVLLFDDDLTISKKALFLKYTLQLRNVAFSCLRAQCNDMRRNSTFLRSGMSILLVNAHLGDFDTNSSCKGQNEMDREDPFWRIKVVKNVLQIP